MALFGSFNNLVNAGLSVLGQQGGVLGSVGQFGGQILRASNTPSSPSLAMGPSIGMNTMGMSSGQVVMPAIRAVGTSILAILQRVGATLGLRNMTLRKAMKIYRKLARTIVDPFVIAQIMGISVGELGELLVSDSQRTRRRMNPANSSALRRAARRIESFHRLCVRTDKLRSPRRRSSPRSRGAVNVKCA